MKRYFGNRDVRSGFAFLMFTALYFSQTFEIRVIPFLQGSSALVPRICAAAMALLALGLIFQGARQVRSETGESRAGISQQAVRREAAAVATAMVILFLAILLMGLAGFILSMFFYLMASFLTLCPAGKRNIPLFAAISVTGVVAVYLVFVMGFDLLLPTGILG